MEKKTKKSRKILIFIGFSLIISALNFFLQIGSIQKKYEEIAKINEERAEIQLDKANTYKTIGIATSVGGIVCLLFGFLKKNN